MRDLRSLRIGVYHPDDADGRQLTQQLQRIGCQAQAFWPPPPTLPDAVDVVFIAVRPDVIDLAYEWARSEIMPTVIAVVTYENPTIVEAVLRLGAKAVIASPVRSFGLLSVLVLARQIDDSFKAGARQLKKLEAKLLGARRIAEAKEILMRTRSIGESAAYDLIREQAMSKRTTTEEIAAAIVNANEILSLGAR
jgi:AmiR/NasT family two-component response regulator